MLTSSSSTSAQTSPSKAGLAALPDLSQVALFLDFDGTLVEIAERPDAIIVPDDLPATLRALDDATGGAVAVVSGRRLDELDAWLTGFDGVLIGSHGAETRNGADAGGDGAAHTGRAFSDARDRLRGWVAGRDGVLLEEKPASLVLHYRQVPTCEGACADIMDTVASDLPGFEVRPSKMAFELMPKSVSKETVVQDLMTRWSGRIPVAIGDDRTDEGMFRAAQALGGTGIKVGEGDTLASSRLPDVTALRALLADWLEAEARGVTCRTA
ncbi:trehalose-phosphatase [Thalassorhabdomicrobium marinisediminis]|uniref:Trehalose 6-phosphate phosphatase n=1 Tax=Thalassorhabdomicrobium marinisediminis TaxID=2170577 RepID=A0A2T7G1P9_9RHOB|nr:trehalose-phosphatase [Thalassorhabdomicrobium marinisediminis]PVA08337.1 trehalose-phosphatase [Thalassorhabdomicrobium marinisediminis]